MIDLIPRERGHEHLIVAAGAALPLLALFGPAASQLRYPLVGAKRISHMGALARFFSRRLVAPFA